MNVHAGYSTTMEGSFDVWASRHGQDTIGEGTPLGAVLLVKQRARFAATVVMCLWFWLVSRRLPLAVRRRFSTSRHQLSRQSGEAKAKR